MCIDFVKSCKFVCEIVCEKSNPMKKEVSASAAIILDTLRPAKDEKCPVRLRVIHKRKYHDYTMKYPVANNTNNETVKRLLEAFEKMGGQTIKLTEDEFTKASGKKPRDIFDSYKVMFQYYEEQARNVIARIPVFTFETFETLYFSKSVDNNDLFAVMASTAKQLRNDGRISTAITFECGLKSFQEFTGKDKLPFELVTVKFLKDYENWMLTPRKIKVGKKDEEKEKVNSRTTVGIYLRNVRTVFNQVKPVGIPYPFGKSKYGLYVIPKGRNIKKALTQSDVAKIAAYSAIKGSLEERSRDLWLFSYLCNGINMKDVARLKYSNIEGDKISLVRAKTADTVDEETSIDIIITRQIGRIIDRHGVKSGKKDQYVFPILRNDMTAEEEYRAIQQLVQTTNKNMKRICDELEIGHVTTYTARHSFATVLKRSGASVEFISESLGHKNKQTTQNYLANFEDDEKRKWANILLPEAEE